jgi:hypothetical protein
MIAGQYQIEKGESSDPTPAQGFIKNCCFFCIEGVVGDSKVHVIHGGVSFDKGCNVAVCLCCKLIDR